MYCPECRRENPDTAKFCVNCARSFSDVTPVDGFTLKTPLPAEGASESSFVGLIVNNYRILSKLGEGGMGAVYLAEHVALKQPRAIKFLSRSLSKSQYYLARFLKEARSAAMLDNPNIVRIFDAGELNGYYYIAMEYIDGWDLSAIIQQRGKIPWKEALQMIKQILNATRDAHAKNIIHRDIKPENIMVANDGNIKVTDFGIAKNLDETAALTQKGQIFGTPNYMSPEQCRGDQLDACSDIYSIGATFYRMLSGRPMFKADTPLTILHMHCSITPDSIHKVVPDVPPTLGAIIHKMLAKKKEHRYQSIDDIFTAIIGFERDIRRLDETGNVTLQGKVPAQVNFLQTSVVREEKPKTNSLNTIIQNTPSRRFLRRVLKQRNTERTV